MGACFGGDTLIITRALNHRPILRKIIRPKIEFGDCRNKKAFSEWLIALESKISVKVKRNVRTNLRRHFTVIRLNPCHLLTHFPSSPSGRLKLQRTHALRRQATQWASPPSGRWWWMAPGSRCVLGLSKKAY